VSKIPQQIDCQQWLMAQLYLIYVSAVEHAYL
jgi:hypothetical protein